MPLIRKWWKYSQMAADQKLEEHADPKVQIEQAINEARSQHDILVRQAATVIGNMRLAERHWHKAQEDLEAATRGATQADQMAQEATDAAKAAEYQSAAVAYAHRIVELRKQVEEAETFYKQTTAGANAAQDAVTQNSENLQKSLAKRQHLLAELNQTEMQETFNETMSHLQATTQHDVPTLDQVSDKIEARYANAQGMVSLEEHTPEHAMLEIEHAAVDSEAQDVLAQLRAAREQKAIGAGS